MTEEANDRTAALLARIKELEEASELNAQKVARGGVFEALWQSVNKLVPAWLAALAVAAFLGYHGYEYYMNAQIQQADTELKSASAAYESSKSKAQNQLTESGVTMQLATAKATLSKSEAEAKRARADADATTATVDEETIALASAKAELAKSEAEASRTKADADAASAKIGDETMSLATARATLEKLQNQARAAQARADAANEQSGLKTLAQREAVAKLVVTEMQATKARISASLSNTIGNWRAAISAACEGTQFPDLIGCPAHNSQPSQPESNNADTQGRIATVANAPQLTLRSCPKISCDDIRHLPSGLRVIVTSRENTPWFGIRVKTDDGTILTGYVNGNYLIWGAK
jgi:hypothetical protein